MRKDLAKVAKVNRSPQRRDGAVRFAARLDPEKAEELADKNPPPSNRKKRFQYYRYRGGVDYGLIKRVIEKQIGRPWDKVYSEFCESLSGDPRIADEMKKTLNRVVHTKIEIYQGDPYALDGWFRNNRPLSDDLYVHPETNLICYAPPIKRKRKPEKITKINVAKDKNHYYELIGEHWYETKYVHEPSAYFNIVLSSSPNYAWLKSKHTRLGTWAKQNNGIEGYWIWRTETKVTTKSCNKKQMKAIREYLEKYSG